MNIIGLSGEQIVMLLTGLGAFLTVYKTGSAILKSRKTKKEKQFNDKVNKIVELQLIEYHKEEISLRDMRKREYEKKFDDHTQEVDKFISKLADNEARENKMELDINNLGNKIVNLNQRFEDQRK